MQRTVKVVLGLTVKKGLWVAAALGVSASVMQAADTVRYIQQSNPAIKYTGTWYTDYSSSYANGSAKLTNAAGAQAVLSFRGTGVEWFGVKDPTAGLCLVYIDGVLNTVTNYASTTLYNQPMYVARGLAPGLHTLSIQVESVPDPNGTAAWVFIDGFNIYNGQEADGEVTAGTGRAEQSNPAVTYTGTWFLNTNPVQSGGTAVLATDAGDTATIAFTGNAIKWIGYRDQYSGIANVYVDGTHMATVDTYSPTILSQTVIFSASNLGKDPNATHTLTIEATGTHDSASTEAWVWVDAFDISFQQ